MIEEKELLAIIEKAEKGGLDEVTAMDFRCNLPHWQEYVFRHDFAKAFAKYLFDKKPEFVKEACGFVDSGIINEAGYAEYVIDCNSAGGAFEANALDHTKRHLLTQLALSEDRLAYLSKFLD